MSARSTGRTLPSTDTAVALGFVVAAAVEFGLEGEDRLWISVPGACLMLVLVVRRTWPLLALTVYTAASCVAILVQAAARSRDDSGAFVAIVALVVMTYSLGAHGDRRQVLIGCWQPVLVVVLQDLTQPSEDSLASALVFFSLLVVALPVVAGRVVRSRRRMVAGLRRQEQELAAAHDDRLAAARAAEALRLGGALDALLSTGLERIEAEAGRGAPEAAAVVETQARELLARTRRVVVALNEAPTGEGSGPALGAAARTVSAPVEARTALVLGAAAAGWAVVVPVARLLFPMSGTIVAALVIVALTFPLGALPRLRAGVVGLGLCLTGILAAFGFEDLAGAVTVAALAWLGGRLIGSQVRLGARLRLTTVELECLQRDAEERARIEERASTAHELHDSIGHALTAMALQAEAARRLGGVRPERAREVLATVGEVAAAARAELASGFAGGEDLAHLLDGARAAGLRLTAELDEECVPPPLRHVVYRVVQEALTNVLRHAPGATTEVRVAPRDGRLALAVRNGPGARPGVPGTAVGLTGMQRRVEAAGGRLVWTLRPDGGFELRACFPGASG